MTATMRAARLHTLGQPLTVDVVDAPTPGDSDVVVRVWSANLVQNLRNVISTYPLDKPYLPLPELPAIFGMDVAGEIVDVGRRVRALQPGTRVYLNPGRSAVDSWETRTGDPLSDPAYTFQGYFGFGPQSVDIHRDYPQGGLCEYVKAPASAVITIPDGVTTDQASRLGYLGTSYAALRKGDVRAGSTVLILGATGTLGVGATLLALALGATRVFAVARDQGLLDRLAAIAPDRIRTLSLSDQDLGEWVRSHNDGRGVDVCIDALNHLAPATVTMSGVHALRRNGRLVSVGAMAEDLPLPMYRLMTQQISILTSLWFSVAEGEDLMRMAAAGILDLRHFDVLHFPLDQANDALAAAEQRTGGFTSIIVDPRT